MLGDNRTDSELSAISILENYFKGDIILVPPVDEYKVKTYDFEVNSVGWELKSLTGSSIKTVKQRFKEASRQAKCIVMDFRYFKLDDALAVRVVENMIPQHKRVRRVLCIKKDSQVVVLKWR